MVNPFPRVSIIIPSHNGLSVLPFCMDALASQTFNDFEVIVGLNLSIDGSEEYLSSRTDLDIRIVKEDSIASSYAARNKALEISRGEIIAFIDDDCIPSRDWLEKGLRYFPEFQMVAGKIILQGAAPPNVWERLDKKIHVNQKLYASMGRSAGGNLLVTREVYNKTGPFPTKMISGGDGYWSKKATDMGFSIVYGSESVVFHPTKRTMRGMVMKRFRIGIGLYQTGDLNPSLFFVRVFHRLRRNHAADKHSGDGVSLRLHEKLISVFLWFPLLYGNLFAPYFIRKFRKKRL